jgi:ketosteroid isomerase-like protein
MRSGPLSLALALALLSGCGPKVFPGSKIPDTPEHREVLEIVSQYQKAMEARDADRLLALASPDYYEDAATTSPDDDYGIDGLRKVLSERFSKIQLMSYVVKVQRLEVDGDKASVDYNYEMRFSFKVGESLRWHTAQDDNRLEMKKGEGGWKIVAGM